MRVIGRFAPEAAGHDYFPRRAPNLIAPIGLCPESRSRLRAAIHRSARRSIRAALEYLVVSCPALRRANQCARGVGQARHNVWDSNRPRARYCGFSKIYPRRRAICPALRPAAQSFLSSATSSASQPMGDAIHRLLTTGWSTPGLPGESMRRGTHGAAASR